MVSLTSVLILDNVSVKLKDDGDVCITMTPSLSPFPPVTTVVPRLFGLVTSTLWAHSVDLRPMTRSAHGGRGCGETNAEQISVCAAELGL